MDIGHKETDRLIDETERRIREVYLRAQSETQAKLDDYLSRFKTKDAIKAKQVKQGKITAEEYARWRKGQICIGKRWQEMVDTLTQDYVNADRIAMSIVNGHTPEAYAINHNYATFQVEKGSMLDTSYTLYDRQTVERLLRDNPQLLPKPQVDIPKDKLWNMRHIRDEITQGILQGEDINKISKRLQRVSDMDNSAAVRNARTTMTGAQNAGRVDAYKRAEGMGIKLEQEWLATLDGRTRHSHRQMDGQRVKVGEKFPNGCRFPGDPQGPGWEVYNCRCTLVPAVKGIDQSDAPRNSKLGGMSYEEWKNEHKKFEVKVPTLQARIGESADVSQINDIMNSQGWFRSYDKPVGPARWDESQMRYVHDKYEKVQSMADLTGCDLESAKSIASSYQQVFEKYPQLVGRMDAPDAQPIGMDDNTYAWCYSRRNGKVQINPNMYSDWGTVSKKYELDVLSGFHPEGTTAESIVTHEIGHAIDGLLAREGILGGTTSSGEFRYASSSLKTTIMKKAAKIDPDIADYMMMDKMYHGSEAVRLYVSEYATKNPKEWFAECFAEYITSSDPRLVASEFGKELEKLIGRLQ